MVDSSEKPRGKVPIREFLSDFRSPLTDRELREKYDLSARGFVSLIKALLAQNIISSRDLAERREMSVKMDLAKESQFLRGLFICRNCSHPSPHPFDRCPACGAEQANTSGHIKTGVLTPAENHIFVEEASASVTQETEVISEEDIEEEEPAEGPGPSVVQAKKKSGESQERPSAVDSLRSLFSKLKKK